MDAEEARENERRLDEMAIGNQPSLLGGVVQGPPAVGTACLRWLQACLP